LVFVVEGQDADLVGFFVSAVEEAIQHISALLIWQPLAASNEELCASHLTPFRA
jgi:hypothetical protein